MAGDVWGIGDLGKMGCICARSRSAGFSVTGTGRSSSGGSCERGSEVVRVAWDYLGLTPNVNGAAQHPYP